MPQLLIELWLNAKIGLRNNANPVKEEGKLIYSIAGEEIPHLFFNRLRHRMYYPWDSRTKIHVKFSIKYNLKRESSSL